MAVAVLTRAVELEPVLLLPAARSGVATNHLPNNPSPFVSPGPLSPEKVYSRCPLYSTWFPLAVDCVVSLPESEVALAGEPEPVANSGGQLSAHELVQAVVVAVSGVT